jgi:hypothetical protein
MCQVKMRASNLLDFLYRHMIQENASLRLIFIFKLWTISMWIQQAVFLLMTGNWLLLLLL